MILLSGLGGSTVSGAGSLPQDAPGLVTQASSVEPGFLWAFSERW